MQPHINHPTLPDDQAAEATEIKPKTGTRLPKEVRMQQIEFAALKVFRCRGYKDGSTKEIAKEAGVTEGLIFKYYPTKIQILENIICTWYDKALSQYLAQIQIIESLNDKLKYAISHNLECMCNDAEISNLYLELRRDRYFKSSRLLEYNKLYVGEMINVIKNIQDTHNTGREPIRPTLIAQMIYSMAEARSEPHRFGEKKINIQTTADEIYELFMRLL
ncbi:TetR/AcrR family transcriptional regulator [Ottowia sp. GY511]|uniref:TetR/AcrR family transcriptional regulator n=1 Tax=Ottowia flava TaxID=2675430 RepID=A0ABW4KQA9_9BURK|nr:TetR/AcrR family transcriptional regulator [Ottowia sp. GY511]TXK33008.1 TetR/AcrR family transcriptional regulator [Ottowia sp. GY511]